MTDSEPPDDSNDKTDSVSTLNCAQSEAGATGGNRFPAHDEDFDGANDEAVAIRISILEEEHRDLDAAIRALELTSPYEGLVIARLKKKKLIIKDQIQSLKDSMLPDIIA